MFFLSFLFSKWDHEFIMSDFFFLFLTFVNSAPNHSVKIQETKDWRLRRTIKHCAGAVGTVPLSVEFFLNGYIVSYFGSVGKILTGDDKWYTGHTEKS